MIIFRILIIAGGIAAISAICAFSVWYVAKKSQDLYK